MSAIDKPSWPTDIKTMDDRQFRLIVEKLYDWWNLHNSGTLTWDNIKVTTFSPQSGFTVLGNITFSPTTGGIVGTTTNNNAAAGIVGEAVRGFNDTGTTLSASGAYTVITSISLTAGDWDLSVLVGLGINTANSVTEGFAGISSSSGDDAIGFSFGDNSIKFATINNSTDFQSIPSWRLSISSSGTYYLKCKADYAAGNPYGFGRFSARRMR